MKNLILSVLTVIYIVSTINAQESTKDSIFLDSLRDQGWESYEPKFSEAPQYKDVPGKPSKDKKTKLKSGKIETGETPLTSGTTFYLEFLKGRSSYLIDINDGLGELLYFYTPEKINWLSFGYSGGVFRKCLWAGPIASISLDVFQGKLSTLHWMGWSLGDPEEGSTTKEILFCFNYHQVSYTFKSFSSYIVFQKYQKNKWEYIPGFKQVTYTFDFKDSMPLNLDKASLFLGGGYIINKEHFLWSFGVNFDFK
jgi:hypothetical protein